MDKWEQTGNCKKVKQGLRKQWLYVLENNARVHSEEDTENSINVVLEDDLKVSRWYMVYLIGTVCALPETTISANKISLISLHPQLLASLMSHNSKVQQRFFN